MARYKKSIAAIVPSGVATNIVKVATLNDVIVALTHRGVSRYS